MSAIGPYGLWIVVRMLAEIASFAPSPGLDPRWCYSSRCARIRTRASHVCLKMALANCADRGHEHGTGAPLEGRPAVEHAKGLQWSIKTRSVTSIGRPRACRHATRILGAGQFRCRYLNSSEFPYKVAALWRLNRFRLRTCASFATR